MILKTTAVRTFPRCFLRDAEAFFMKVIAVSTVFHVFTLIIMPEFAVSTKCRTAASVLTAIQGTHPVFMIQKTAAVRTFPRCSPLYAGPYFHEGHCCKHRILPFLKGL